MDSAYSTLWVFLTKSMSNDLGNLAKISLHLSLIISSGVLPAPPEVLGKSERTVLLEI